MTTSQKILHAEDLFHLGKLRHASRFTKENSHQRCPVSRSCFDWHCKGKEGKEGGGLGEYVPTLRHIFYGKCCQEILAFQF